MALDSPCAGHLSESTMYTSQAANLSNEPNDLCDQIFYSLTSNVSECSYIDLNVDNSNLDDRKDFLIVMHLNIRSLNKH